MCLDISNTVPTCLDISTFSILRPQNKDKVSVKNAINVQVQIWARRRVYKWLCGHGGSVGTYRTVGRRGTQLVQRCVIVYLNYSYNIEYRSTGLPNPRDYRFMIVVLHFEFKWYSYKLYNFAFYWPLGLAQLPALASPLSDMSM